MHPVRLVINGRLLMAIRRLPLIHCREIYFIAASGTHPIQLIVTDSSCLLSDTVITNVNVVPLPAAEAGNNTAVCSGTVVQLGMSAVAGVAYQWSPAIGLSNPIIANPTATLNYTGTASDTVYTYYLSASAGVNCTSIDSVKITVKRKPVVIIDPAVAQICIGNSVSITASGADTYSWLPSSGLNSSGTSTVIATPLTTTTYSVTGTLTNGCSDNKSVTVVVNPDADANFTTGDTVRCAPVNIDTLINNIPYPAGNGTYNWYADNVLIASNTAGTVPSYVINTSG